jgi:phospholipid/cholesterol/gamma-HCH transport system substrate-binding protein
MNKSTIELIAGIFVLIGIVCIGYLTIRLGKMELLGDNNYLIYARFESVAGLRPGAQVEISGVTVGRVESISLDQKRQMANVKMKINKDVQLTDDAIASVKTSGLIGDKYIMLSLGASEEMLAPGDTIVDTQPAMDVEELVSKYVFGGVE